MTRIKKAALFPEEKKALRPNVRLESRYRQMGFSRIAGVDEAGRGPLAGPVVAAAAILPQSIEKHSPLKGLRDSKALSAGDRER